MKEKITSKKLREFGYLIGLGFPIVFGWLIPTIFNHDIRIWTLGVGIPLIILGLISPKLLIYPYKIWMKLGFFLGFINSHIILGLVFYIMLIPIAIIMKLIGYDPLKKNLNGLNSFKEYRQSNKIDLTRIF